MEMGWVGNVVEILACTETHFLLKHKIILSIVIIFLKIKFRNYFDHIMYFKDMNLQTFYKDRR